MAGVVGFKRVFMCLDRASGGAAVAGSFTGKPVGLTATACGNPECGGCGQVFSAWSRLPDAQRHQPRVACIAYVELNGAVSERGGHLTGHEQTVLGLTAVGACWECRSEDIAGWEVVPRPWVAGAADVLEARCAGHVQANPERSDRPLSVADVCERFGVDVRLTSSALTRYLAATTVVIEPPVRCWCRTRRVVAHNDGLTFMYQTLRATGVPRRLSCSVCEAVWEHDRAAFLYTLRRTSPS